MKLPLLQALARITSAPAGILGIDAGRLCVGEAADICVFDPHASQVVQADGLRSQGKNTPFLGLELPGRVRYTLIGGDLAYSLPFA